MHSSAGANRDGHAGAAQAAERIEPAVDAAYAAGIQPCEFGDGDGTPAAAVLTALDGGIGR